MNRKMKGSLEGVGIFMLVLCVVWLAPRDAHAYIGPGAGLSSIGAFLAIVFAFIAMIFGFLWYPIKRLLKKRKKTAAPESSDTKEP